MHERFSKRIEEGLESLARRIEKSKSCSTVASWNARSGGCWKETHGRRGATRLRSAKIKRSRRGKASVEHNARSGTIGPSSAEGTYILRSNIHDWTDEELWKTYIQLSEAEAAFRIHKSDLCIRPIWHHKQDAHQGAYSDLLSRLRVVEDAAAVAVPRRAGRFPAHDSHRAVAHSLGRYRVAAGGRLQARVAASLRGAA